MLPLLHSQSALILAVVVINPCWLDQYISAWPVQGVCSVYVTHVYVHVRMPFIVVRA